MPMHSRRTTRTGTRAGQSDLDAFMSNIKANIEMPNRPNFFNDDNCFQSVAVAGHAANKSACGHNGKFVKPKCVCLRSSTKSSGSCNADFLAECLFEAVSFKRERRWEDAGFLGGQRLHVASAE